MPIAVLVARAGLVVVLLIAPASCGGSSDRGADGGASDAPVREASPRDAAGRDARLDGDHRADGDTGGCSTLGEPCGTCCAAGLRCASATHTCETGTATCSGEGGTGVCYGQTCAGPYNLPCCDGYTCKTGYAGTTTGTCLVAQGNCCTEAETCFDSTCDPFSHECVPTCALYQFDCLTEACCPGFACSSTNQCLVAKGFECAGGSLCASGMSCDSTGKCP